MHGVDPHDWSWNESWFFSFVDLHGGPAAVFRVGVTPNQGRAMLWCFVHADGGWYTFEESRLAFADLDLSTAIAYDRWGLRFSWEPERPLQTGRFSFAGTSLVRSGPLAMARVPVQIELTYRDTADPHGTGLGPDEHRTTYPTGRFEQSLAVAGTVVIGDRTHPIAGGAHRDKSWGPREWRQRFTMGDLQGHDRQLYFVGTDYPGRAGGYLRHGDRTLVPLRCVDGAIRYDDGSRTIGAADLAFAAADGSRYDVHVRPIAPSIVFDIAHTCPQPAPEPWLYWRTLVEATVSGWDEPVRGWFEASRFGVTG